MYIDVTKYFISDDGTEVRIGGDVVQKTFANTPDALSHVSFLGKIYGLLLEKEVPNVDRLKEPPDVRGHRPYILMTPVGADTAPSSGRELYFATVCILQALQVSCPDPLQMCVAYPSSKQRMHSGSRQIYHRDIRKPNIMKRFDKPDKWFLIDWSEATITDSTTPTRAARSLATKNHSPRVFEDDHGAEVDIWGVGNFLRDYAAPSRALQVAAVEDMGIRWMNDGSVTAEMALREIQVCQLSDWLFPCN